MFLSRPQLTRRSIARKMASRFSAYLPVDTDTSLLEWGRDVLPQYYTNRPSLMHQWMAEEVAKLDQRGQQVVVVGPRGGAKSVIFTLTAVLKRACEGTERVIIICSDTASQAIDHLRTIKEELETNDRLEELYPNAVGIGPIWRENYIQLRNGCVIRAVGTLSRIRGLRRRQTRPSLIVLDDPQNDEHTSSKLMRGRTKDWFNRTLMHMGDAKTNYLVCGTAIHRECLVLDLLRTPGWTCYRENSKPAAFKAIVSWPHRMDLWEEWERIYHDVERPGSSVRAMKFFKANQRAMLRGAEVLWPDREPLYAMMERRAQIGHQAFAGEKQGDPINPDTCEWPRQYFVGDELWFDKWPKECAIRVMAVDPSKGRDASHGDYSAVVMLAVDHRGVFYVDCNIRRRSTDRIVNDALELHRRFRPAKMGIETNQFQSLFAEDMQEEAIARDIHVDIVELDNRVKKEMRIRRLSPLLAQRRMRFRRGEGCSLLLSQLQDFPNGDHDDGPDALEMATRIAADELEGDDGDVIAGNLETDYE